MGRVNTDDGDFPGGPVAKTVAPSAGAQFWSLVRELDPTWQNKQFAGYHSRFPMMQLRPSAAK